MASLRLSALAAAAAVVLATTSACSSGDSDSSAGSDASGGKVNLAVFASLNGAPAYAAESEGVFGDHDLDVKITTAKTSSEMVPQLIGGKVDIALLDTATSMVAASQGLDLVYIAGATDGGIPEGQEDYSFANVWVRKDSPIKTLADLTGKTIAVPQIKSQPWVDLKGSVDDAGGDSSKIKFTESPDPLTALKSKQADATTTSEPVGTIERAKDELRVVGPTNSGGGGPAYVYVATGKFAKANPELIASFGDAVREANVKVNGDSDLLVKTAAKVLNAPADVLAKAALPVYAEKPLTVEDIATSIAYLKRYDMFEQAAPSPQKILFKP
ncbi:ABC transporter substrate-binding protein [Aeromicrobium wangtongii]|uniref:ABC transporter substrate-binding protein n=1 Tax=Aeromicrobium wangtongii TaxID=2969247 RepID=UPI00201811E2|nr:ABC transporter substrate-binding protein [Aeromicrobium wangtongii]MCL3820378.1 ABC transporter substrate-binding protein [Aeromicrobium wangtongii]